MKIKIETLFLLVFFVQQAGSQNTLPSPLEREITLEAVNMPVSKILKQIEKQTRLRFSYNSEITGGLKPVTASFRNKKITEMISLLFDDRIKCKIKNNYVILSPKNKVLPSRASKHSSGTKREHEKSTGKKEIPKDTVVSLEPSKNNSGTAAYHPAGNTVLTSPGSEGSLNADSLSALPAQLFLINNDTTLLLQEEDTASTPK